MRRQLGEFRIMQTVIEDVKSLELHPILCGFNVIISGAIVDETRQGRPHIGQTKKKKKKRRRKKKKKTYDFGCFP